MITEQENELLTRVGPGTRMGSFQRRYWHVVGAVAEMGDRWTKPVRLLGENLVLFKDRSGSFGLIAQSCPHRRASLLYGIPTENGIRCPYHGWQFDRSGHCVEQPNEPEDSAFKDKISTAGYPVETLGGLIWAYLGPQPAPLLPRWDGLVGENVIQLCAWNPIDCNWLQIMENSVDPVHAEWLHGKLKEFLEEKSGKRFHISRKHLKIDFTEFPYGIYKRRLLEGQTEDEDDWKVGHPVLFPNTLALGSGGGDIWKMHHYQFRVPVDDEHTMHYNYFAYTPPPGVDVPQHLLDDVPFFEMPVRDAEGNYILGMVNVQDVMAWETQGPIAKRHLERLGTTDVGVIVYRKMLMRELERMEAGEDPIGVVRTPHDVLEFALERNKAHYTDGFDVVLGRSPVRYAPVFDDICQVFSRYHNDQIRERFAMDREKEPVGAANA